MNAKRPTPTPTPVSGHASVSLSRSGSTPVRPLPRSPVPHSAFRIPPRPLPRSAFRIPHSPRACPSLPGPCVLQPVNFWFSCENCCLSRLIFNFPAVPLIGVHWCLFVSIRGSNLPGIPPPAALPCVLHVLCVLCVLYVLCGCLFPSSDPRPETLDPFFRPRTPTTCPFLAPPVFLKGVIPMTYKKISPAPYGQIRPPIGQKPPRKGQQPPQKTSKRPLNWSRYRPWERSGAISLGRESGASEIAASLEDAFLAMTGGGICLREQSARPQALWEPSPGQRE
jgi:hypothetical protein